MLRLISDSNRSSVETQAAALLVFVRVVTSARYL